MTVKDVTILIITLLLCWSGMVIADISAGDNFIFECTSCSLGEEVLDFIRSGSPQTYTITVNSAGSFSIDQGEVYKFKIDSSGNVNWPGTLLEGDFDLKLVLASTACPGNDLAYGIDSGGLRCINDCDADCLTYGSSGGDRTCDYLTGDQNCEPCSTCNGASAVCVVKAEGVNDRCPACTACNASGSCVALANGVQDTAGDYQCNGFCKGCYAGACINAAGDDPGNDCATSTTSALGCAQGFCDATGACQYYTSQERNCPTCYTCNGATGVACVAIGNQIQDPEGSNTCNDVCRECNGSGTCVIENGTDHNASCPTEGCYTGLCNAGGGACAYNTSGEGNCGVCKTCNASGVCVAYTNNTQDTSGTTCDGPCAACIAGECKFALAGTDPAGDCGTDDCYTGMCKGTGVCDAYSDGGQHRCPTCYHCSDTDGGCEYLADNYPDSSCGQCKVCNGTGSCKGSTTHWGAQLFGCTAYNQRCYGGTCKTCTETGYYGNGYFYNDNCNDCADQGGKACWRNGSDLGHPADIDDCTAICSNYGGVVNALWNDTSSCVIQNYMWGGGSGGDNRGCIDGWDYLHCSASNENNWYNDPPELPTGSPNFELYASGMACKYRHSGGTNDVNAQDSDGVQPQAYRICVCNY